MTRTKDLMVHLRAHAYQLPGDDRWYFGGGIPHSEKDALQIVEACMSLDVPVTDAMTSGAWLTVVRKLTSIEDRLATLEGAHS